MDNATELITRPEASAALRVSIRTLDHIVAAGELPIVRIGRGRGRVFFRRGDIDRFIDRNARARRLP
jgi:predicted DNA-binding transcriptional regulator AlpA